ncbi:N-acetyl sugar amidotransferase [bacterium]|nr:N-acetyl sugar amidotransferase [bacterium]
MNPTTVQTCRRCLYTTNHPLGLVLDDQGICSGCRVHEEKDTLDWSERWERLEELVKPYRCSDSRNYDCIVPVSGAGDSFFIVHLIKERLGLNPLLVTYNRYYNTPIGIRNLAHLRRRFNCDILIQSVNPLSVKKIVLTTLRKLGSFHWPVLAGQSVFPVQTAVSHKVPLIIWGAHQGLEQVGMFSHKHEVEMTRRYRKDHDLMGYEADDLLEVFNDLREEDVWQYRYPHDSDIANIGVRGIYLGNYVRWDPFAQHLSMVEAHGYKGARFERTFDVFDHVDDWHYCGMHDYIKYLKHGYSRVLDQACREIRHNRITRLSAIAMVNYYMSIYPTRSERRLTEWLNISSNSLNWILEQSIGNLAVMPNSSSLEACNEAMSSFEARHSMSNIFGSLESLGKNSVTIGKGFPD